MRRLTSIVLLAAGAVLVGEGQADPFRDISDRYVRLVLAVGQHDADYVDAYYGNPDLRKQAEVEQWPLADIETRAAVLEADVSKAAVPAAKGADAELWRQRKQYLQRQLAALRARV